MKKKIFVSLALVALIGVMFAFGPRRLGGPVSYVVTSGSSMEPGMSDGDLVIVREAASYEVGDAVAYMNGELGTTVLHRIVRKEGNRNVFKGDNNDFLDTYEPTDSELLGRSWMVIPGGGTFLKSVTSPAVATSIAVVLGLSIFGSASLRRRRRSPVMPPPTAGVSKGIVPPTEVFRRIAPAVAIGLGLFLVLGLMSFTRPTVVNIDRVAAFEHQGRFTYRGDAEGARDVYDSGQVATGDPVYRSLVKSLTFGFDYALEGDIVDQANITGELSMAIRLSSADGWKRNLPMAPTEVIDGPTGTIEGTLDLAEVNQIIQSVEAETGFDPGLHNVDVIASVLIEGEVASEPIEESFEPSLGFTLDPTKLQPVQSTLAADEASTFNPTSSGGVRIAEREPSYLSLFGQNIEVADARLFALGGLGLLLLISAAVGWGYFRARALESDAVRILARFPDRFAAAQSVDQLAGLPAVEMTSIEELVRLADAHESLLLYVPVEPIESFMLEQGGVVYYYSLVQQAPERPADSVVEEVREILLDELSPSPPEEVWLSGKSDVG